ncbi:uncharacterized protein PHALS_07498 [Plasmopara halstedii]|uniref:Uncharacterized protein n=1 Tax=Plasmopara halstedii TaxID=4781 RepID=A0A0P1B5P4_PLAHL|nr:uncharacterized protein PHALS_07498 [Plasmopara halstedii]CEG49751.1 hypothetical protein PHALS_07498 [Plasmopara halstedii]|eukprot:XP_024586120.1 hypothetical protein PHALS_07498 [Plasmopara halstedii]
MDLVPEFSLYMFVLLPRDGGIHSGAPYLVNTEFTSVSVSFEPPKLGIAIGSKSSGGLLDVHASVEGTIGLGASRTPHDARHRKKNFSWAAKDQRKQVNLSEHGRFGEWRSKAIGASQLLALTKLCSRAGNKVLTTATPAGEGNKDSLSGV